MPFYRVNEVGALGLIDISDKRPYEIPPQAWSYVLNARMINGAAKSVNGWTQSVLLTDATIHALDYYTGPSPGGVQHWYAYGDANIYSIDPAGTVTPVQKAGLAGGTYPNQIWITDKFNETPVATNDSDPPQCFYNAGGTVLATTLSQDLPDWGAGGTYDGATCLLLRAYKNFLVALNITESGTSYPNLVAWSDASDPGLLPASWDYADPATLAGRAVVGGGSGRIVAAEVLRDSLYIYTEYETWRMDFVGGQFVMRFTRVFSNMGAFGPRCVGKYSAGHLVVTKDDVIGHDGQQNRSFADERVRRRLFLSITEEDRNALWVSPYLRVSEMWIGLPDTTLSGSSRVFQVNEGNNAALVWQWQEPNKPWSVRELPNTRYMRELPTIQSLQLDDSWDLGPDDSWEEGTDAPWTANVGIGELVPIITSTDMSLYYGDYGPQLYNTILQREDISLSVDQQTDMAKAVYPRMNGEQDVSIRLGFSNVTEGLLSWDRAMTYNPKTQYHVVQRAQGRRHAIEFVGMGFDLFGYDIEFVPAGRR